MFGGLQCGLVGEPPVDEVLDHGVKGDVEVGVECADGGAQPVPGPDLHDGGFCRSSSMVTTTSYNALRMPVESGVPCGKQTRGYAAIAAWVINDSSYGLCQGFRAVARVDSFG